MKRTNTYLVRTPKGPVVVGIQDLGCHLVSVFQLKVLIDSGSSDNQSKVMDSAEDKVLELLGCCDQHWLDSRARKKRKDRPEGSGHC